MGDIENSGSLVSGEKYQDTISDEEKIQLIRERRNELDAIRK